MMALAMLMVDAMALAMIDVHGVGVDVDGDDDHGLGTISRNGQDFSPWLPESSINAAATGPGCEMCALSCA